MLFVFVGVALLLCAGGIGIGILLYNDAAEPDRTGPDVAADGYLRALLVERDDARAGVFACTDPSGLSAIRGFRDEIEQRERDLQVSIVVNLEDMRVDSMAGGEAVVAVTVRRTATVAGDQQSLVDKWTLRLRDEGGWRVCEANRTT